MTTQQEGQEQEQERDWQGEAVALLREVAKDMPVRRLYTQHTDVLTIFAEACFHMTAGVETIHAVTLLDYATVALIYALLIDEAAETFPLHVIVRRSARTSEVTLAEILHRTPPYLAFSFTKSSVIAALLGRLEKEKEVDRPLLQHEVYRVMHEALLAEEQEQKGRLRQQYGREREQEQEQEGGEKRDT